MPVQVCAPFEAQSMIAGVCDAPWRALVNVMRPNSVTISLHQSGVSGRVALYFLCLKTRSDASSVTSPAQF
jgi:hypothetical protein